MGNFYFFFCHSVNNVDELILSISQPLFSRKLLRSTLPTNPKPPKHKTFIIAPPTNPQKHSTQYILLYAGALHSRDEPVIVSRIPSFFKKLLPLVCMHISQCREIPHIHPLLFLIIEVGIYGNKLSTGTDPFKFLQ